MTLGVVNEKDTLVNITTYDTGRLKAIECFSDDNAIIELMKSQFAKDPNYAIKKLADKIGYGGKAMLNNAINSACHDYLIAEEFWEQAHSYFFNKHIDTMYDIELCLEVE